MLGSSASFLVEAGIFFVWLPFGDCGYGFVRAREGHAVRLLDATTGACDDRATLNAA